MNRLLSTCRPVTGFTNGDLDSMFEVFQRHYRNADHAQFCRDFREKDDVILLSDAASGRPYGFSTLVTYTRMIQGRSVDLLFSGDTIIDCAYWGQQELVKAWCAYAGKRFARTQRPTYWLLLSKGYRTYLYLPLFFRTFYPRRDASTPPEIQVIIDDFGRMKYGEAYSDGLVRFANPRDALREDLAVISDHRLRNPPIAYFLEKNPGYRRGDELVCLAPLHAENMRSLAAVHFRRGYEQTISPEVVA